MYIEFDESLPVYTQIIDGFKQQIFGGQLDAGARIPPVRELAAQLEVNPNTLQKALGELERCGLVKARRTAGRYVTVNEQEIIRQRQEMMAGIISRFVRKMSELGCSYEEILGFMAQGFGRPEPAYTPQPQYEAAYVQPMAYDTQPQYTPDPATYGQPGLYQPQPPLPNADLDEGSLYTGAGPYVPTAYAAQAYAAGEEYAQPLPEGYTGADILVESDYEEPVG